MSLTFHIAKHLREVYFGENWTASNLKEQLRDVSWHQATTTVNQFNTIASLISHSTYYVREAIKVFEGSLLDTDISRNFEHQPIHSEEDWKAFLDATWSDVEACASYIEAMPEHMLWENFTSADYGTYYRNLQGVIEHAHYHLGQIALIKKLLVHEGSNK